MNTLIDNSSSVVKTHKDIIMIDDDDDDIDDEDIDIQNNEDSFLTQ